MIYKVSHTTRYTYADAIPLSHNVVRMRPRDHSSQTCRWHTLSVLPIPAVSNERLDYFGNQVTWLSLQEPHTRTDEIAAESEIEVKLNLRPDISQGGSWKQVSEALRTEAGRDIVPVRQYTFDSLYVKRSPELAAYALESFIGDRSLLECVLDLSFEADSE